ncbi:MAG TPA: sulfatase-like hydrolase/transferase [Candidatus Angelobacter sp.]|jgi:arylsulfatase A-like enzyme|nr:sulfatase-like hydrolase/transferase [Candidatus Angelobacter sp.]
MTLRGSLFFVSRLVVAVFTLLTSFYCLLAYIPFTYHQIHLGGLLAWVSVFVNLHPYLYWLALAAAAWSLPWQNKSVRTISILFLCLHIAAGVILALRPLLAALENNIQSLLWCFATLVPLVWLAAIDWMAQKSKFKWQETDVETDRLFRACLFSGIYAWLLSAVVVLFRYVLLSNTNFGAIHWLTALAWSLALHLLVFMAIFLLLNFAGTLSDLVWGSPALQVLFYIAVGVTLVALILKSVVLASLSFSGWLANVTALVIALGSVIFLSGVCVRLYEGRTVENAFSLLLSPLGFLRSLPLAARIAALLAGSALGGYLLARATTSDWEYLLQKLIVCVIWAAILAFFYVVVPEPDKPRANSLVFSAAGLLCLYMGFIIEQPRLHVTDNATPAAGFLDEFGNYDVSFRLTRSIFAPPVVVAADDSIHTFLADNTNIPRSVRTEPVDINLVAQLAPAEGPKPNIFVFVIDSLRSDYLSAYNPAVTFTPGIEAFARESVVFKNAFTRYTGTGLSEPSIWTGAMLLHKQYVTPFYPMNSLQKLLEAEKYQQFIARDEILRTIMAPSELVSELQAGQTTMNLNFCPAAAELQSKISQAQSSGRPIFAYMQPQDIHVSVINRENRSVPPGESYPGFEAAYAARMKSIDKCFGGFIEFLKSRGLYSNSLVVLTADHGDSLGEKGRWGHAYNVVPEVARIPLIVHLPESAAQTVYDQNAPAFLVDVTPSLYYLLGHHPIEQNPLFGHPLFTMTPDENPRKAKSSYVIASSYGAVYGLLSNEGNRYSLYVANAVDYKDYFYEWTSDNSAAVAGEVSSEVRANSQQQIRQYINDLDRFYNFSGVAKP